MKHAILGAGAIGGLVATALASLGEDVTLVVRPENLAGYPKSLTLERPQGSVSAPAKAAAALTESVDVLWITTNTYQLQTALEAVHSLPTCAVPLCAAGNVTASMSPPRSGWLLPFGRRLLLITCDFSFEQFKEGVLG